MDHSLTILLVCKILYFNFCYYPNLSSLAFKGSVDKQSRVTVSRNFCYYHVLFKEAPVYLTFTVSENLHFYFCVLFTLGPSQEICFGHFQMGVFLPPDLKSGVSYSQSPMPSKDHTQYCSLI